MASIGSRYGFTIFMQNNPMDTQAVTFVNDLIGLGNGGWIRPQQNPSHVFPNSDPSQWAFTIVDDAVGQINASGLNCWFSMGNVWPAWLLNGFSSGGTTLPGVSDVLTVVTAYASRYDGKTTPNPYNPGSFLHIEAFDLNELWDLSGNPTATRDWSQNGYPAIQAATYNEIKSHIPNCLVATMGMLQRDPTVLGPNIDAFYSLGGKKDLFNWHYHLANNTTTPFVANTAGNLTFDSYWQFVQQRCASNGDTNARGAVTEAGIAINTNFGRNASQVFDPLSQSKYLRQENLNSWGSGFVDYHFIYTVAMTTDGMSLTQNDVAVVPTYADMKTFYHTYPTAPSTRVRGIIPFRR